MRIDEEYVRVEGIEISGTGVTNARAFWGLSVNNTVSTTSEVRIDGSIVHDVNITNNTTTGWTYGIYVQGAAGTGASVKLSNNIVYNVTNPYSNFVSHVVGIQVESATTSYAHNNTIYRIRNYGPTSNGAAWGLQASNWATMFAKNNYVGDVTSVNDPVKECYDAPQPRYGRGPESTVQRVLGRHREHHQQEQLREPTSSM
jgi:hypothetical protein